MDESRHALSRLNELLEIMARLRDPERGCPWDLQQDFSTVASYTLEEAYEVVDAIGANSPRELREELGDLLFQVVFHAQMAKEKRWFEFADVVAAICEKMIRRHPHVFGDECIEDAAQQTVAWERHKAGERSARSPADDSALAGVPLALPALTRAQKLQRRAANQGFDWERRQQVVAKLEEEVEELKRALADAEPLARVREELGDVLFSAVNLARFLDADAESLLRAANEKFNRRFRCLETLALQQGKAVKDSSPEEMETWWRQAKNNE